MTDKNVAVPKVVPKKDNGWIGPVISIAITLIIFAAFYFFFIQPMQKEEAQKNAAELEATASSPDTIMFKLHDAAIKEGDSLFYNGTSIALNVLWQPDKSLVSDKEALLGAWRIGSKYSQPLHLTTFTLSFDQPISDYLKDLTVYYISSHGLRSLEKVSLNEQTVGERNANGNWPVNFIFPEDYIISPNASDIIIGVSGTPKKLTQPITINTIVSAGLISTEKPTMLGAPNICSVISDPRNCPFTIGK